MAVEKCTVWSKLAFKLSNIGKTVVEKFGNIGKMAVEKFSNIDKMAVEKCNVCKGSARDWRQ